MNKITYTGTIIFDPTDKTAKHQFQSSWKKIAMVVFKSKHKDDFNDLCNYYAWFVKKRFGIILNPPLRGPHISFINDHINDLNGGFYDKKAAGDDRVKNILWDKAKAKYHKTEIDINISTEVQTNGEHWWLRVQHEDRKGLQAIRDAVGLPIPNLGKNKDGSLKPLGIHMTLGYPVNGRVEDEVFEGNATRAGRMNLDQSMYVNELINKGLIKI
jgi:hypothetical protein